MRAPDYPLSASLEQALRVILTQLPDVYPRTPRNAEFRLWFYNRWGKENCIVSGLSARAEYRPYQQTLSVKMAARGREHYFIDRRRLTVSDESYLVLNEGRTYGSLLEGPQAAYSFAIFFRPGMAAETLGGARLDLDDALDTDGEPVREPVEFAEHLRRHDSSVSPVLKYIQRSVASGVTDLNWYEEQLNFLLGRLLRSERCARLLPQRLECIGRTKRRELLRRIDWATDFIHSNLHRCLTLADVASAARLSQYHFLRVFRQVYGVTPFAYLRAQRTQRALALLSATSMDIGEVARQVGLSRLALWRHVRESAGVAPRRFRDESPSATGSLPREAIA